MKASKLPVVYDLSHLEEQKDSHHLFDYPLFSKALQEACKIHYDVDSEDISKIILSFISSKSFHIIPGGFDSDPDGDGLQLLIVSINDNKPLFKLTASVPESFSNRDTEYWGSSGWQINSSNNHIWIEWEDETIDMITSDEDEENEDDDLISGDPVDAEYPKQCSKHYLLHARIIADRQPRITRVTKMKCPLKVSEFDVFEGKKETFTRGQTGCSISKHKDIRNYQSCIYYVDDQCVCVTKKNIYLFNTENSEFEKIAPFNHLWMNGWKIPKITTLMKHYNVLDLSFLMHDYCDISIHKNGKILCILHNLYPTFKIDFIQIPNNFDSIQEPALKKRKLSTNDTQNKNVLFSMDLNILLSKLYDVTKIMIHGFCIDVEREIVLLVVNKNDVLLIDKQCNLIKQQLLDESVFPSNPYWRANNYIVTITPTLNGRDYLFTLYSTGNSAVINKVIVNGYDLTKIEEVNFENHIAWGRGRSDFGGSIKKRNPCDLSNINDLFPIIY